MGYTEEEIKEIFNDVLERIEQGESLRSVLRDSDKPSSRTFYKWLDEDDERVKQYAHACQERAVAKFESIEQDYNEKPERDKDSGKIDPAWVNLQRLKIDSKKWELSKLNPKKYGDKVETTLQGGDKPIQAVISLGNGINPNESTS